MSAVFLMLLLGCQTQQTVKVKYLSVPAKHLAGCFYDAFIPSKEAENNIRLYVKEQAEDRFILTKEIERCNLNDLQAREYQERMKSN